MRPAAFRAAMSAIAALAVIGLAAGCSSGPDLTPKSGVPVAATVVEWDGKVIEAGDRVIATKRAGTFKPADTGHAIEVNVTPGRTGLALGGMPRNPDYAQPGEPIQVVLVRWDPQMWNEMSAGQPEVPLGEFEATVHADFLEAVKE